MSLDLFDLSAISAIPRISHNDQVFVVRRFEVECGLG